MANQMDNEEIVVEEVRSVSYMPTWQRMDRGFTVSTIALIVTLLPSIVLRLVAFGGDDALIKAQGSAIYSAWFNGLVILVGLVLALVGIKMSRDNVSARTVAIFALIVCVLRLALQS